MRSALDSALERLREVSDDLRRRAQDQTAELWQQVLEEAPEKLRREMGRRAIRAQQTSEALKDLSAEICKREADLRAPTKGDGS